MAVGHAVGGFFLSQTAQPAFIEMIDVAKARYPQQEELTTAMSAALYNSMLGTAYLIAPIYGGSVTQVFGFKISMDILALIDLIFVIFYLTIGEGYSGFVESFRNFRK